MRGVNLSDITDAILKMTEGIITTVNKKINDASYDKTVKARITEIIQNDKYKVCFNGSTYTVKAKNTYEVNDIVYVMIPQNNYNEMFIVF